MAVCKSRLARQFHEDIGASPAAFLRAARADRMVELLADPDLSIADARRRVGWIDVSVVSRSFRAEPVKIRQQHSKPKASFTPKITHRYQ
ncbi:helix-turn-helix domain-containing protein [Microbacterium saperdae]